MQKPNDEIQIGLQDIAEDLMLEITAEGDIPARTIPELTADLYGESIYQLLEGRSYEYELTGARASEYSLRARTSGVVVPSKKTGSRGRIVPNIFVGRLVVDVIHTANERTEKQIALEVVATKFDKTEDKSYRENYRRMLEDITDHCTDLMMQVNTPVNQYLEIDYTTDSRTMYQRFCFVKSFLETSDFEEAILRIIGNPSTTWMKDEVVIRASQIKRINRSTMKQLIFGSRREDCSDSGYLSDVGLTSLPYHIQSPVRRESTDTAENRFIKHVLQEFENFVQQCLAVFNRSASYGYAASEAKRLSEQLSSFLGHSFFSDISQAVSLKLNSPLLQKRSGYREVLNRWLQFDLASKLIWNGGEDVYEAGKRDIATLYEYWLFFQLYDLIVDKFDLEAYKQKNFEHLFEPDEAGLSLKLKSGKELIINGVTRFASRNLSVRFSYNRTFKGGSRYAEGKHGSITTTLRPDYTLSIWPASYNEDEAEKEDVIVHIHFDAKYKIQDIQQQYTESDEESEMNKTDIEERKGTFKNVDLLKMHAYKDAIRRTGGAYILYPGKVSKEFNGFHEVLPGLGAFTINPSLYETGISGLSLFLDKIINHLKDRTTHRERIANNSNSILKEPVVAYGTQLRPLSNDMEKQKTDVLKTNVLVGFIKTKQHLEWYLKNKLYNFRMNDDHGTLIFEPDVVQAKYLLLRESGKAIATQLFRITSQGPKVFSKAKLEALNYPRPTKPDYLVISIEPCNDWDDLKVNYKKLEEYKAKTDTGNYKINAGKPFVVTLDKILRI
ncbi:DUF2357 domain-containing protein [Epilithonimonas sp.]|uniref:DUF2357 domain-containing protein n=1 Tax=Epilithonimonas sp. TaxID=2894511 RepID=UPI002FDD346D